MCKNGAEIRGWHNSKTLQFYIIWRVCLKVSDDEWTLCLAFNCCLYVITCTACFPVVNIKTLHRNYRWSHILEKKKSIGNTSDAESIRTNFILQVKWYCMFNCSKCLGGSYNSGSSTISSGRSCSSNSLIFLYLGDVKSHSAYKFVVAKNGILLWNTWWHSDTKLPLRLSWCVNCVLNKVYLFNYIFILTPENNRIERRIIIFKHIRKSKFLSCLPNYSWLYEQGLKSTVILSSYRCGKGKNTWYLKG